MKVDTGYRTEIYPSPNSYITVILSVTIIVFLSEGSLEFLATDPQVLGWIPGASRFSEKQRVWNGVHSASSVLVSITEELLGRNSSGFGQENRD
jgi:hypothetical protein